MQTLDLSGDRQKSDGYLKSLFWPTVENAWDVDYLGQQGFWLCFIIAVLSFAFLAFTAYESPNPIGRITVLVLAGIISFVYLVGGMGVRQSSWLAAAFIFTLYVVNALGSGRPPGILTVIIAAVLLSNVRATFLASRWKPATEDEDRPMRFNETFRDKLVDQLPPKLWPILRIPFFIASGLLLLFLLYVSVVMFLTPHRAKFNENAVPSVTIHADPDSQ
ncbi:MAG TPA: hypothetical protein VG844_04720 [Terracidiphilus sp.]|nr:hypothetical protein [Terracidiphilus sp.]